MYRVVAVSYVKTLYMYRELYRGRVNVESAQHGGLDGRPSIDSGLNEVLMAAMGRLEPFGTTGDR